MHIVAHLSQAEIKQLVYSVVDAELILMVKLFGSRANGTAQADSDYDILIELNAELSDDERRALRSSVRKAFWKQLIPVDVLVLSPSQCLQAAHAYGSAVHEAHMSGIAL